MKTKQMKTKQALDYLASESPIQLTPKLISLTLLFNYYLGKRWLTDAKSYQKKILNLLGLTDWREVKELLTSSKMEDWSKDRSLLPKVTDLLVEETGEEKNSDLVRAILF
jgi:hypothetical protein